MLIRLFSFIRETHWIAMINSNKIRVKKNSHFIVGGNTTIKNCNIFIENGGTIKIGNNCNLKNVSIYVNGGRLILGDYNILCGDNIKSLYILDKGDCEIADHTKLLCKRLWARFGGQIKIGSYTNINSGSEIRSDDLIIIGNYNQISYNVNIWDTNTHNIYSPEKRKEITQKYFPYFGYEYEKPKTSSVKIGNNCWIGERASILKGSILGDNVIVGYNTLISNKIVENDKKVVEKINLQII